MRPALIGTITGLALSLLCRESAGAQTVDFNRDVRPILSGHCFKCHGPDDKQRQAGLRLDQPAAAAALLPSKNRAIVPGKPDKSGLVQRILASGPRMMPPAHANKPLSDAQKQILKRWIASGAAYKPHWAFLPPKQAPLPKVKQANWPRNPIDYFVLSRLEKAGLKPSPQADRITLLRRASLDLIGLPPTPEEADAFLKDTRPDAYERLVDRLLASPHYGERWGRRWLDLARYADTNGYEKDRQRSIWPYRDWVIQAINKDMPFDRFTIEQLAGDLLPNATLDQKIATGFHRNTMLNEEGGIDPQEFRFYAMTDRMATTGTTWLGLTIGCAQCHTHKFDPITHKDYYRMMAFLNNADEPEIEVPRPDIAKKRQESEAVIAHLEADLPNRFPIKKEERWTPARVVSAESEAGAAMERLPDNSVRVQGKNPDTDTYTIVVEGDPRDVTLVRLEALTDPSLGNGGPGRTPHGNFVLTELSATVSPLDAPARAVPVKFVRADADVAQDGFPPPNVFDGDLKTGWAVHGPGNWNVNHALTLRMERPLALSGIARWTFRLAQTHGQKHTLGRFRISLGEETKPDGRSEDLLRREAMQAALTKWLNEQEPRAVRWTALRPTKAISNSPLLTRLDDSSILSTGDVTKRDVYDLDFKTNLRGVTAIRLEVLPDDSLPKRGPGRVFYEGPQGDFYLSDLTLSAGGSPRKLSKGVADIGNAQAAVDGSPQSGWSINGGQGQPHTAVFRLEKPLDTDSFHLSMVFEQYYAVSLGRFRISVTTDPRAGETALPPDVEEILQVPAAQRAPAQSERLVKHFVAVAPELAAERDAIKKVRDQMPAYPTTLAFRERPSYNPRLTRIYHRGEFLKPAEAVSPGLPAILSSQSRDAAADRLSFARWLVSERNPLVGRVTMNREWAALFGRGIVQTTEDFGYQGTPPTHPELLDWLAVEFMRQGWSLKKMHRLLVTSATYRQSSTVTPALKARDPQNRLLARGPRVRLDAELIRDSALTISGLLSRKIGGPSVFPPQPPGVTSEGTYGPLQWKVSEGEDRYRRGLYTFCKRTAPYAMFITFDGPSGDACLARREVSNTPLQALTLLNDAVFVETSQALGRLLAAQNGSIEERAALLFRRCVTRPPDKEELTALVRFYENQKQRFTNRELDAAVIAGEGKGDVIERAAWTTLARSVLNLDEVVTKR